ncbi:MAG: flippase [Gemmatimonadaceae bacterium]|nr:flippase [Gemmatimonadaceae bacterium]
MTEGGADGLTESDARVTPVDADVAVTSDSREMGKVAQHTALNVLGLAVPFLVAFLLLPVITRSLGPARFGMLGLAWAILEYLTLFDLGLNRATVKFASEAIAKGRNEVSQIAIVSLVSQVGVALVVGLIVYLIAPMISSRAFSIPAELLDEGTGVFRVIGISLPVVLCLTSLRGVLEAAQRFGVSNAIKIPSSAASIVIPAICAPLGMRLDHILLIVLAARVITCMVLAVAVRRNVPGFRWELPRDWGRLRTLFTFGGWVAVSSVVSPILVYIDRFALAAIVGVASVAYYVGPYEAAVKLLLLPVSLSTALFPALSGTISSGRLTNAQPVFSASLRNVFLVLMPPLAVLAVFAPEILGLWLGPDYARESTTALRILALGVLINGLAQTPFTFLQAAGRPDLTAKFHIGELALHLPLTWVLVHRYGVAGAATAWLVRVTVDTTLLLWANRRLLGLSAWDAVEGKAIVLTGSAFSLLAMLGVSRRYSEHSLIATGALVLFALLVFAALAWWRVLEEGERVAVGRVIRRRRA